MMPDLAISDALWAIDVTHKHRTKSLIIKIRKEAGSSKTTNLTMDALRADTSGAGDSFSPQELDVSNAPLKNLAVVVGEVIKGQAPTNYAKQGRNTHARFSEGFHTVFPSSDFQTAVVVVLFGYSRVNLYALVDKKEDLCSVLQLPASLPGLAWYSEWLEGVNETTDRARNGMTRKNIGRFIKSKSPATDLPSDLPISQRDPDDYVVSNIEKMLILYRETKDDTFLNMAARHARLSIGRGDNIVDEETMINTMILETFLTDTDDFTWEEAEEVSKACEALWFRNCVIRSKIRPQHIHDLAHGIRRGALDLELLPESLYRPFVMSFCLLAERDYDENPVDEEELAEMVKTAWRQAAVLTGGQPPTSLQRTSTTATGSSAMHRLVKAYSEQHSQLVAYVDKMLDDQRHQFPGGRTPSSTLDLPSMLERVMNAGDISECTDAMEDIAQLFSLRAQADLETVRESLRTMKACDDEILEGLGQLE